MPLVFSYGSLQDAAVQLSTFGRRLAGVPDELVGFERSLVPIADARTVESVGQSHHVNASFTGNPQSRLGGTLFELTDAELAAADAYERTVAYERITVVLASGTHAWVYVHAGSGPKRTAR
jgi:hypothetical protein